MTTVDEDLVGDADVIGRQSEVHGVWMAAVPNSDISVTVSWIRERC
jgi:hypothetical protein